MRQRPYQRRRRGPILTLVVVLAVAAVATWTTVLVTASSSSGGVACPTPTAGPPPGTVLPPDALDAVAPVPPSTVKVRVLNAGGQRGQANLVAAQFGDLGFAQGAAPENDPLFPDGNMTCKGQIRFGPAGEGAASTVALAVPCVELVRDARTDAGVDVAVGTAFGDVNPAKAARAVLDRLAAPATGDGGASNAPPAAPTVDQATLKTARDVSC
ncbi:MULTISPECIES: envelope integrity protein Cei [unclassified Pseudonocardia]|uniref:envelope integrity protein Cei n=1 Tax=unclassified Pseudonocardia TaxID=2619320 RepID=UPI000966D7AF|nr:MULTISPECIES: envelope integrity protein Cei [unclassified Pseudonocardia]MBN9100171.1 envelope integrity protein Cei [Pseudonocardia sp.]OJY50257.1 MAG: hypothetical protein BGP03_12555 [Pseudonocardia sp. 73-21]